MSAESPGGVLVALARSRLSSASRSNFSAFRARCKEGKVKIMRMPPTTLEVVIILPKFESGPVDHMSTQSLVAKRFGGGVFVASKKKVKCSGNPFSKPHRGGSRA